MTVADNTKPATRMVRVPEALVERARAMGLSPVLGDVVAQGVEVVLMLSNPCVKALFIEPDEDGGLRMTARMVDYDEP